MTAFNEASRLAAQRIYDGVALYNDLPSNSELSALHMATSLEEGHLVVIERDLVERLVAALDTVKEDGCCASIQHGEGHSQECAEELRLMLAAAKAAGFGGKPTKTTKVDTGDWEYGYSAASGYGSGP